jgi:hypothetical protein
MARVIHTGSAQQKQQGGTTAAQLFKPITPASVQKESQDQRQAPRSLKDVSQLSVLQPQVTRQKQSQEMVQIMLHVSVSIEIFLHQHILKEVITSYSLGLSSILGKAMYFCSLPTTSLQLIPLI